jgi:UDP-N-acetylmuramate dehydrogenase
MIYRNISLKPFNTFGLDYKAETLATVNSEDEAVSLIKGSDFVKQPLYILGGGSNLLFTKDQEITFIHPLIYDIRIEEKNDEYVIISSGCGVKWDDLVEWSVNNGFSGIENLSYIPGTAGASPVQNIGAYGVEARDTIEKVRTINLLDGSVVEFSNKECRFGYRYSIFKDEMKGKYMVTRVYYRLSRIPVLNTAYGSLNDEAIRLGGLTLKNLRQAVINIRQRKLPDPAIIGNAGSFFKNPIVESDKVEELKSKYSNIPIFPESSGKCKLAAGWMIEKCGWKGKRIGDAGIHDKQALVIVNYGKATGNEIFDLSEKVRLSVLEKFGISLDREVEVL